MAVVETVRGPVDLGNLGQTLMHEHITDDVLPALLAAGVTQAQIDTMMVENPVKYFTPAKGGAS
jgi:predicted metal-dependent phosphotriesterase family hydrolase